MEEDLLEDLFEEENTEDVLDFLDDEYKEEEEVEEEIIEENEEDMSDFLEENKENNENIENIDIKNAIKGKIAT